MLQILSSSRHSQKCYIFRFSLITKSQTFHYECCWETEKKQKGKSLVKCFMKGQRRVSKRKARSKEFFKCFWRVINVCCKTATVLNSKDAAPWKNYLRGCPGGFIRTLNVINSSPTGAGQGSEGSMYFHQMKANI